MLAGAVVAVDLTAVAEAAVPAGVVRAQLVCDNLSAAAVTSQVKTFASASAPVRDLAPTGTIRGLAAGHVHAVESDDPLLIADTRLGPEAANGTLAQSKVVVVRGVARHARVQTWRGDQPGPPWVLVQPGRLFPRRRGAVPDRHRRALTPTPTPS